MELANLTRVDGRRAVEVDMVLWVVLGADIVTRDIPLAVAVGLEHGELVIVELGCNDICVRGLPGQGGGALEKLFL